MIVDWELGAQGPNYFEAVKNVQNCAKDGIKFLQITQLNPKNIHCIGHSLGAHVNLKYFRSCF
jgi:pimeloyl-ACP methyl ester carboxylesterase